MSDAGAQITLKVKKKPIDNSMSRTGMKSPNLERNIERDRELEIKEKRKKEEREQEQE